MTSTQNFDNFVNIPFTADNIDSFALRTSILGALKKVLPKLQGNLLDVGCGKMPYKNFILSNSCVQKYTGLDLEEHLRIIYDINIKPDIVWDGITMPIEDESYDCAIATEVLEHVFDPLNFMKEVHRVLKKNGIFFFTIPFLWPLHEVPNDAYRYTPWVLEKIFKQAGFKEINLFPMGGWHASLAQMLGLWVRRSGIDSRKKKILSLFLKPIIKYLLTKDSLPQNFYESCMITGLYGILTK